MRRLALLSLLSLPLAAESRIVYSKTFPGSVPPFVIITLERDGRGVYKEAVDDEQPIRFQLSQAEADEVFSLASRLDYFKRPLEANLKVANMGLKTFRWENGPETAEVKFNYSQDPDARALADWFERMTETEQHFINLERAVKFDKLGANKALLHFQAAIERNRLVALEQFLPLLDRVAKNASYLQMARERAAALAEAIRAPKPKPAGKAAVE